MLDSLIVGALNGLLTQGGLSLADKFKKMKLKGKVEQGSATDNELFKYNELLGSSLADYVESSRLMHAFLVRNPNHLFPNITLGVNGIAMIIQRKQRIAFPDMKQLPEFDEVRQHIGKAYELVHTTQDSWLKGLKNADELFLLYVFKVAQAYYFKGFIEHLDGNTQEAKQLKSEGVKLDKRVLKMLPYGN
ncbi:hypothetical protein LRS06_11305 [Hymenobacter sp. J193]|uniref:hypothetical protein n=1 Tax=Hymenobacter sp. J193 TaxID=2898429 RepID=UPI002151AA99|nr:hypothetical protein [Hymenobacter sp. J193]MCR5888339.1 hypothetical protein [Hymenobacter sp. J193]